MCLSLPDFKLHPPRTPPPLRLIDNQWGLNTFEYISSFLRCINGFKRSIEISSDWATANRCVLVVCPFAGFIASSVVVGAATTSNNTLHKLSNVRSDDDGEEQLGLRRPNELLKKLLKELDEDHQQRQLTAVGSGSSSCGAGSSAANQLHHQHQLLHQDQQTSFQEDQQQLMKSFGFPSPTTTSSGFTQTGQHPGRQHQSH